MEAILTKLLGMTETQPTRIKAYTVDGNQIILAPQVDDDYEAHHLVAVALQAKMGRPGRLIGGGIKGGYAFVFLP